MIAAVLWDLDNTLIDRAPAQREYCRNLIERELPDSSPAIKQQLLEEMLARDDQGYAPREDYFCWIVDRLKLKHRSAADLWGEYQENIADCFSMDETVCRFLRKLAGSYPMGIVSNGSSKNQRRKLERTGIANIVSDVWISGEVGFEKPHPEIFRRALNQLNLPPEQVLFVGDHPQYDIAGAANMGMQTCWVRMGRSFEDCPTPPTLTVESILELEHVLL